jgi:hypothetical protein
LLSYLGSAQGFGRNSSLIGYRGIQDLNRDSHGGGLAQVEAPFEEGGHLHGGESRRIRYQHCGRKLRDC